MIKEFFGLKKLFFIIDKKIDKDFQVRMILDDILINLEFKEVDTSFHHLF